MLLVATRIRRSTIKVPRIKRAYAEVISYNKKNLERELQNESRHQAIQGIANRQQNKVKRREEEL